MTDQKLGLSLTTSPLAAAFQAATAFFNFLSTTEGQKVVEDIRVIDQAFVGKVHGIFNKIHDIITPDDK